jgi:hypothetical protein
VTVTDYGFRRDINDSKSKRFLSDGSFRTPLRRERLLGRL